MGDTAATVKDTGDGDVNGGGGGETNTVHDTARAAREEHAPDGVAVSASLPAEEPGAVASRVANNADSSSEDSDEDYAAVLKQFGISSRHLDLSDDSSDAGAADGGGDDSGDSDIDDRIPSVVMPGGQAFAAGR